MTAWEAKPHDSQLLHSERRGVCQSTQFAESRVRQHLTSLGGFRRCAVAVARMRSCHSSACIRMPRPPALAPPRTMLDAASRPRFSRRSVMIAWREWSLISTDNAASIRSRLPTASRPCRSPHLQHCLPPKVQPSAAKPSRHVRGLRFRDVPGVGATITVAHEYMRPAVQHGVPGRVTGKVGEAIPVLQCGRRHARGVQRSSYIPETRRWRMSGPQFRTSSRSILEAWFFEEPSGVEARFRQLQFGRSPRCVVSSMRSHQSPP